MPGPAPPVAAPPVPTAASRARNACLAPATALSLAGAAGVHAAALPGHAGEGAEVAVFFAVAAILQLVAALVVSNGAGPRARLAIIAGNVVLIGLWLGSRTTGLPLGPHAGVPEAVSLLDALAVAAEVAAIIGVFVLGRRSAGGGARARRVPALVVAALLVGGAGTAWAEPSHSHKPAGIAPHEHTTAEHHDEPSPAPTPVAAEQPNDTTTVAHPHDDGSEHHHAHP